MAKMIVYHVHCRLPLESLQPNGGTDDLRTTKRDLPDPAAACSLKGELLIGGQPNLDQIPNDPIDSGCYVISRHPSPSPALVPQGTF